MSRIIEVDHVLLVVPPPEEEGGVAALERQGQVLTDQGLCTPFLPLTGQAAGREQAEGTCNTRHTDRVRGGRRREETGVQGTQERLTVEGVQSLQETWISLCFSTNSIALSPHFVGRGEKGRTCVRPVVRRAAGCRIRRAHRGVGDRAARTRTRTARPSCGPRSSACAPPQTPTEHIDTQRVEEGLSLHTPLESRQVK